MQQKKTMSYHRYRPYPRLDLPDRTWPGKTLTQAPIWCSVDLRDGNQALCNPMNLEEKAAMFELLVGIGFKEIEVAFPAAAEVEFEFVRKLIEEKRIPEDVTIQVLTQAREPLIRRTFEALRGVSRAIVHVYNSTSVLQRKVVFRMEQKEITQLAVSSARLIKTLAEEAKNPGIRFQYSPESFTGTEPEYALDICREVLDIWQPAPEHKAIINLPATVEMNTPNVYADLIEWFHRHLPYRNAVTISVHAHNDRGTAVAAAELAVLAGADRVEGSLFGNGERTGNMDVLTMAMNLFSQGIDPKLDFSHMDSVIATYENNTHMKVHSRHPYAGSLVYTAFSGSHQDAINKGIKAHKAENSGYWEVPYLPIDPQDVGRTYESIIRINSQSGKGGVAFILEQDWGFMVPKAMHPDVGKIIQVKTEKTGRELTAQEVRDGFLEEYANVSQPYRLKLLRIQTCDQASGQSHPAEVTAEIESDAKVLQVHAFGQGPVDAFVHALQEQLQMKFTLDTYSEHAIHSGSDAEAVAYIGITLQGRTFYGVGIDRNISTASAKAILSAVNRGLAG